jgi:hypothetical protein
MSASKNKGKQSSQSIASGYTQSTDSSFAESQAGSRQGTRATDSASSFDRAGAFSAGQDQSSQNVWGGQGGYLQDLYAGGAGAVNQAQQERAAMLPDQQAALQRNLRGGVNPELQAYAGDVQENFTQNILPQIQGQAGMHNAIGGSRQGVAEGVAGGMANRDVSNFAAKLYGQDQDRALSALGMTTDIQNQALTPYQQLAGIIGGPTVLGESSGATVGGSQSIGGSQSQGDSKSIGSSESTTRAGSQSQATGDTNATSTSKGKNKGKSLGL